MGAAADSDDEFDTFECKAAKGWQPYDDELNKLITRRLRDGDKSPIAFSTNEFNYVVNLERMVQVNEKTRTERKIRKRAPPAPAPARPCDAIVPSGHDDDIAGGKLLESLWCI